MSNATGKALVSIIIPAFNEERIIGKCLESVARQSFKNIEVVLVDDCSSDNTNAVVQDKIKKLKLNLNLISLKSHQERGKVRNLGSKKAKGEYLLFIDADMILTKKVIAECLTKIMGKLDIGGIIIPEESRGVGFWAKCRRLEKKCYLGDDSIEAARFFKKNAFWKVGGWDEEMISGEDWDLTRRIREKYEVIRVNAEILHDEGKLTLWMVAKKKFYYAFKSGIYLKKYPLKITDLFFFIFRPAYLKNWKLILSDPTRGAGMFFLKAIEMFAGGIGYLFSKLPNLP
ncbi:glycosyltransferase [Candidatus Daviesbacteria bacterium]|nr:glycosyltransferase [Candidatus Daviesbacteria bacterium]